MTPNRKTSIARQPLSQFRAGLTHKKSRILASWEASNPQQVIDWANDGSLETRLTEAVDREASAQAKAMADGVTHLSTVEINEIYGGPNLNLR